MLACLDLWLRPTCLNCGLRLACLVYRPRLTRLFHHPDWFSRFLSKPFLLVSAISLEWPISALGSSRSLVWPGLVIQSRTSVQISPRQLKFIFDSSSKYFFKNLLKYFCTHLDLGPWEELLEIRVLFWLSHLCPPQRELRKEWAGTSSRDIVKIDDSNYGKKFVFIKYKITTIKK